MGQCLCFRGGSTACGNHSLNFESWKGAISAHSLAPGPSADLSDYLVLAAHRTKRPDILRAFKPYRGGWNITNNHYWASSEAAQLMNREPWCGGPRAKIPATVLEGFVWLHFHFPIEELPIHILPKAPSPYQGSLTDRNQRPSLPIFAPVVRAVIITADLGDGMPGAGVVTSNPTSNVTKVSSVNEALLANCGVLEKAKAASSVVYNEHMVGGSTTEGAGLENDGRTMKKARNA